MHMGFCLVWLGFCLLVIQAGGSLNTISDATKEAKDGTYGNLAI